MTIKDCPHCGGTHYGSIKCPFLSNPEGLMCSDCPPVGYPTDETRCEKCPRRRDKIGNDAGYMRGFRAGVEATIAEVDRQTTPLNR